MTDHTQREVLALKLTQLQAMTACDALVSPEYQQRAERKQIVDEILTDYAQAHAAGRRAGLEETTR